jgi:Domain of unknown function (DUF4280)
MPGFLLHIGARLQCAHPPGQAQPMQPSQRVFVMGQPIVTQISSYGIAGCALTGSPNPPCATAQWTKAATKVFANGMPVLLQDSQSICTPTGTPLTVLATQTRVRGV